MMKKIQTLFVLIFQGFFVSADNSPNPEAVPGHTPSEFIFTKGNWQSDS